MIKALKRGGALLFSVLLLTGCTGTAGANTGEDEAYTSDADTARANDDGSVMLKIAELHVAEHPITKSLVAFADEVEEKTEGRVKIDVCPAELLGSETEAVEKVRSGSLDMARVNSVIMCEYSANLTPLALPYVFESREHMWKVVKSPMGDEILSNLEGCEGLAWIENGARCFYSSTPIYSPEDMKGKKFRVPNSKPMYAMLEYYGATPVTLELSEVYDNIADNSIRGAENDIISYDYFANSVVAKYYVKNNHSYAPAMLIGSRSIKDKIGDEDYAILLECAKDLEEISIKKWDEDEAKLVEDMKERGVQIIEPNEEHMQQFKAAADAIYAKFPECAEQIEQIRSMK